VVTEENQRATERTEGSEDSMIYYSLDTARNQSKFLNYLAELFDSSFQPVLKKFMGGIHGNGAAFCAAVVQSDLGKLD